MATASVIEIKAPSELDRQTVREFFYAKPMVERAKIIFAEMLWVLTDRPNQDRHLPILPDYCYNIFDALRVTFFKNFPVLTDIIFIKDPAALPEAKTIEAAKKVIQVDWKKLGQVYGIALRCLRFAEMEAKEGVDGDGFNDVSPDKVRDGFVMIFGNRWVEANAARIMSKSPDVICAEILNESLKAQLETIASSRALFDAAAYQWSTSAVMEFQAGLSAGLAGFMAEDGQLVGTTNRSDTYTFLLLAWPEIQAMLEANPRKTLTDLHSWMLPFMRVGVTTHLDIDQLRNVCAAPSQNGIGLSLRPIKSSPASA